MSGSPFEEAGYVAPEAAAPHVARSLRGSFKGRGRGALDVVAPMRRGQVLALCRCIENTLSRERWAPSRRELAEVLKCSASTIARVVEVAEEAGFVERLPRQSRAIRTTKKGRALLAVRWS